MNAIKNIRKRIYLVQRVHDRTFVVGVGEFDTMMPHQSHGNPVLLSDFASRFFVRMSVTPVSPQQKKIPARFIFLKLIRIEDYLLTD